MYSFLSLKDSKDYSFFYNPVIALLGGERSDPHTHTSRKALKGPRSPLNMLGSTHVAKRPLEGLKSRLNASSPLKVKICRNVTM